MENLIKTKYTILRRFLAKIGYKLPIEGMTSIELDNFIHDWDLLTTKYEQSYEFKVKQFKVGSKI
jgi:hypothetical protein